MKQSFTLSAGRGGWRVAIIDSIDDMNKNGVNALLKLIEEPPEKCLFLIVCHNPGGFWIPYARAVACCRLMRSDESRFAASIVQTRLRSDPNEVAASAFLAEGSAGYALMLAEHGRL